MLYIYIPSNYILRIDILLYERLYSSIYYYTCVLRLYINNIVKL